MHVVTLVSPPALGWTADVNSASLSGCMCVVSMVLCALCGIGKIL